MGRHVRDIWVEQAGEGPDVLLIAGVDDTVEAWQFQGPVSVEAMADDAAGVLLPQIVAPTLVLAGGQDSTSRPEPCRTVADRIPGAPFEVMEQEAHQPFQEVQDQWNGRVHAFWRDIQEQTP